MNVRESIARANAARFRAIQSGDRIDELTADIALHAVGSTADLERVKRRLIERGITVVPTEPS